MGRPRHADRCSADRHRLGSGWEVTFGPDVGPVSPNLAMPSVAEVLAAIERFPLEGGWRSVADSVLPVFPRARPPTLDGPAPVTAVVEPGVTIGYAVDLGTVFARISVQLLEQWGIGQPQVHAAAMTNLRRLARSVGPADVVRERALDGYVISIIQPPGAWGSTLLLLPDELRRVFGPHPQILVAPMRSLLMSFAAYVDRATVAFFTEEFESIDPSHLLLEGFVLRGNSLMIEPLPRTGVSGDHGAARRGAQMS